MTIISFTMSKAWFLSTAALTGYGILIHRGLGRLQAGDPTYPLDFVLAGVTALVFLIVRGPSCPEVEEIEEDSEIG